MQAEQRIDQLLQGTYTDFVLIRIESKHNTKVGSFELNLSPKLIQNEFTPDDEVPDAVFNEERNIRTSGVVVAAPSRLNPITLYEKYCGTPLYSPYVNHEIIKDAVLRMQIAHKKNPQLQQKLREDFRKQYNPGNPVESYEKQHNNPEILPGDEIHFEYTSLLSDLAYFDEDSRGQIYIIPYQSIYCYVRNGITKMINGWVLVESVTIEKFSEHVILINHKPQQNVGKIAHCSPFLDNFCPNQGDTCLFLKTLFTVKDWDQVSNSFEVSGYLIDDKIYYPMRQWQIVAVEKEGKWQTVNDYVTIKPEKIHEISGVSTVEYDPNAPIQTYKPGQIFIPAGSNVQEKKKKILNYGVGTCNGQKVIYGKSDYYLYMDELDLLFLHKKDIFGTFTEEKELPERSYRHEEKYPELYINPK